MNFKEYILNEEFKSRGSGSDAYPEITDINDLDDKEILAKLPGFSSRKPKDSEIKEVKAVFSAQRGVITDRALTLALSALRDGISVKEVKDMVKYIH